MLLGFDIIVDCAGFGARSADLGNIFYIIQSQNPFVITRGSKLSNYEKIIILFYIVDKFHSLIGILNNAFTIQTILRTRLNDC